MRLDWFLSIRHSLTLRKAAKPRESGNAVEQSQCSCNQQQRHHHRINLLVMIPTN